MIDEQSYKMKWILFWVILILFVLAALGTFGIVFLGFGTPTDSERELLVKALIGEVAAAVIALFYSMFNLKKQTAMPANPDGNADGAKVQNVVTENEEANNTKIGGDNVYQIKLDIKIEENFDFNFKLFVQTFVPENSSTAEDGFWEEGARFELKPQKGYTFRVKESEIRDSLSDPSYPFKFFIQLDDENRSDDYYTTLARTGLILTGDGDKDKKDQNKFNIWFLVSDLKLHTNPLPKKLVYLNHSL